MDEQLLVKIGTSVIPFIVIVAATLLSQRKSHAKFVKISELWIYPIKSCKGIKVEQAEVTSRGFELDRIFMIADSSGKFMSQRSHPSMALIDVRIAMENGKHNML